MSGVAFIAGLTMIIAAPPAFSNAWVHWLAWREIEVSTASQPTLVRFEVPVGLYGSAQLDFVDVRVIDDTGREVPFVVDSAQPRPAEVRNYAPLSDVGFVPGRYTQAVADAGGGHTLHNTLRLTIPESESDFFEWVAVDASDDRATWRVVRERAPIFRFRTDGLAGQQQVSFPETSSRWLRVRILDGQRRFSIDEAMVSREVVTTSQLHALPAPVRLNSQSPERKSWWDADLAVKDVPVAHVSFAAAQPAFHRPVTVSVSDDGATWTEVAESEIYREGGSEQLSIDVSEEGRGRYWRVTVLNRNDAPIDGLRVRLWTTPRYVVFRQMPERRYFVLYGNSRATAPEYDFATLTTREQRDGAPIVTVGAESTNAAYQSPEPWTETHGWVLWIALLAAVVIIGWLAIRSMRVTPPT